MKVALFLVAIFGLTNAAVLIPHREKVHNHHVASRDLNDLLQQLINFIPFDKCKEIVDKYIAENADVQAAYAFLLSDEFKTLTDEVVAMPEYQNFMKYLYDAGLDIYTYQNIFRKMLDLPPIEPPKINGIATRESGIITMIKEILNALPIVEIKEWFYNVCLPDPDFQNFLEELTSQEFRDLAEKVYHTKEYRELTDVLRSQGIDVDAIEKVIADFISGAFVKKIGPQDLSDLLDQFAAFIPFDECLAVVNRYLETDPDVQQAYAFLKSDEFAKLADKVEKMQEYQDFLKYLSDSGLDIYKYENLIRRVLGLPPIEHFGRHNFYVTRESGLIKMIIEILNLLPIDEIKDWFLNVCIKDPSFQELIERIQAPEFQGLVEAVTSTPEYKEMTDVLRSQGIDVDAIEQAIEDWVKNLPVGRSLRTLKSLLAEFLEFIPTDDILNILLTYLQNDPDVQRVFEFLQGDDFRNLVVKLEGVQELIDFLAWVYGHDIDIYTYINTVLDLLGIPTFNPPPIPHFRRPSVQSGLTKMIDDILAILPVDDIIAWYNSTCSVDPEFLDLLAQLRSDKFQVVVDTVKKDPAFPIMHDGLKDLDVDIDAVEAFLHDFFGW